MKLITQVRYGIRILLDIAMHQSEGVVQMSDVASRQKISLKYLEQLIRPFKDAGLVESKRGRKGGHRLSRSPDKVTLAQIIKVFEKKHDFHDSEDTESGYSQYQDSLIRDAWAEGKKAFYQRLECVALSDLSVDTTKKLWGESDLLIFE